MVGGLACGLQGEPDADLVEPFLREARRLEEPGLSWSARMRAMVPVILVAVAIVDAVWR